MLFERAPSICLLINLDSRLDSAIFATSCQNTTFSSPSFRLLLCADRICCEPKKVRRITFAVCVAVFTQFYNVKLAFKRNLQ